MDRLEFETLERCKEIIEGRPVTIRSTDPRLQGDQAWIATMGQPFNRPVPNAPIYGSRHVKPYCN